MVGGRGVDAVAGAVGSDRAQIAGGRPAPQPTHNRSSSPGDDGVAAGSAPGVAWTTCRLVAGAHQRLSSRAQRSTYASLFAKDVSVSRAVDLGLQGAVAGDQPGLIASARCATANWRAGADGVDRQERQDRQRRHPPGAGAAGRASGGSSTAASAVARSGGGGGAGDHHRHLAA
ncbi:MAG: hypothetical protein U0470_05000 [Anaerolineae bacterium]